MFTRIEQNLVLEEMWEEDSDNNVSDNALTLSLQAYGADVSGSNSLDELCTDSDTEKDSGSPEQRNRKRKRSEEEVEDGDDEDTDDDDDDVDMPDVIQQMEAEIERQLDAKAKKSNLTVANVKNILKDIITNEQVLDLVRHTMKQPESNFCINKVFSYAPKLTRAKTRELLNTFPSMAWPITPSKNVSTSKCKVLIEQDLSEDSSDEEYQPDKDELDDTEEQKTDYCNDDQDDDDEEEDDDDDDDDEPADSDEADAQADEEEEDEENSAQSNECSVLNRNIECHVNTNKKLTELEQDDYDDDDDCRLVICDDNDNKEINTSKFVRSFNKENHNLQIKKCVNNDFSTLTSWSEENYKKGQVLENPEHTPHAIYENNENICQRTRSKLSLSDTPLEAIESAFIPPDITTDMYDSECDDEDWKNFLKGFTQPLKLVTQDAPDDDDDDEEIDPEYNIMADEEDADDKEELREDPGVKVSRREVNALMAELFEYIGMLSDENDEPGKSLRGNENEFCENFVPKNVDEMKDIAEHIAGALEQHTEENVQLKTSSETTGALPCSVTFSPPKVPSLQGRETIEHSQNEVALVSVNTSGASQHSSYISPPQKLLIEQHMRKHVQLLTQHFLLSYLHPLYHVHSMDCKQYFFLLKHLANNNKKSVFYADNLDDAMVLLLNWEQRFTCENSKKQYVEFLNQEIGMQRLMKKRKQFYRGQFPPGFMEIVSNSNVFVYPLMLPTNPFRCDGHLTTPFFESEDHLIAMGLEHFMTYAEENPEIWGKVSLQKIVPMIVEHFVPIRRPNSVYTRILDCSKIKNNPIQYYYQNKKAPTTVHYVVPSRGSWLPPCEQPLELLPDIWKDYVYSIRERQS